MKSAARVLEVSASDEKLQTAAGPGKAFRIKKIVPSMVPGKWNWHYKSLARLLERMRAAQRAHLRDAADTKPGLSTSTADSATDEFDRDLLLSEASSEQGLIYQIEQALKRIENGSYGICEMSRKRIPKARLRAIPWTRFSQESEFDLECHGAVRPAHLGEVGSVHPAAEIRGLSQAKKPDEGVSS